MVTSPDQETADASLSDAELVVRSRAGDEAAFGQLVNRHWGRVAGCVAGMVPVHEVDDVAQETFVRAFRSLGDLREPDKLAAWLQTMARNAALKALRQRQLERQRLPAYELAGDLQARQVGADAALLEDFAGPEGPWPAEQVRAVVKGLPNPDRAAVVLVYLVGLKVARAAELLSIPEGTVKSRLHRARKNLKERMQKMARAETQSNNGDHARDVIGGMRGLINWDRMLQGQGLEGWRAWVHPNEDPANVSWERQGDAVIGSAKGEGGRLVTGDETWGNFELSMQITPISGGNAQVFFRYSEAERTWYLFDMMLGWQAAAISRMKNGKLEKLSVVNYPLDSGQEYDVQIAARGASLTTYIDGKLVNQTTDETFASGAVALNLWQCSTAFRDLRYRLLH